MFSQQLTLCTHVAQVVTDFFDELKSRSRGYASMEYKLLGYRKSDLVRLDIKINQEVSSHLHPPCDVHAVLLTPFQRASIVA